jgi:hypothetical protein
LEGWWRVVLFWWSGHLSCQLSQRMCWQVDGQDQVIPQVPYLATNLFNELTCTTTTSHCKNRLHVWTHEIYLHPSQWSLCLELARGTLWRYDNHGESIEVLLKSIEAADLRCDKKYQEFSKFPCFLMKSISSDNSCDSSLK